MKKYGLKLYSTDYQKIAVVHQLVSEGLFDFVELYAFPETFRLYGEKWRGLKLPFVVHAAHSSHAMNLALKKNEKSNLKLYKEAAAFAYLLAAEKIIFHPGISGTERETTRQLKKIHDKRAVIENKPCINLFGKRCVGSSYEGIKSIMQKTGCELCLDIGHLIKSCYLNDLDFWGELNKWLLLTPAIIHLNDGTTKSCFDDHLNFGKGDFPLSRIIERLKRYSRDLLITIETPKSSNRWVGDVRRDFGYILGKLGR